MMKTYAEAKGFEPFNWIKWMNDAIAKLPSSDDLSDKLDLASGWPTCACGNLCDELPRRFDGSPEDDKLRELGCRFLDLIESAYAQREFSDEDTEADLVAARTTFLEIEARSAELLSGMGL